VAEFIYLIPVRYGGALLASDESGKGELPFIPTLGDNITSVT